MSQLEVFQSIAKEIKIDNNGRATVTIRGAARIVDIKHPTLLSHFEGGSLNPSKLAEKLMNAGFEGGTLERFSETGSIEARTNRDRQQTRRITIGRSSSFTNGDLESCN